MSTNIVIENLEGPNYLLVTEINENPTIAHPFEIETVVLPGEKYKSCLHSEIEIKIKEVRKVKK